MATVVEFTKKHAPHVAGDRAAFPLERAKQLVGSGSAQFFDIEKGARSSTPIDRDFSKAREVEADAEPAKKAKAAAAPAS